MATSIGGSSNKAGKGKKPHKNKPTSKKYKMYKVEGDKVVRNSTQVFTTL